MIYALVFHNTFTHKYKYCFRWGKDDKSCMFRVLH